MLKPDVQPAPLDAGPDQDAMIAQLYRQYEVERLYCREARLLDDRKYHEWLDLFTEDATYWMPIRRTMSTKELDQEFTQRGSVAFFDEDRTMLALRVKKLETGYSWSEDPPSRTRHLITNVEILSVEGDEMEVQTNFHLYRTRLNSEENAWIGHRRDRLRRIGGELKIAARSIFLEETVLLSPNLSSFF
jgi:biphenyl 2,3-dioxygenase beta subunit